MDLMAIRGWPSEYLASNRSISRNRSRGGANLVFWKIDHHSQTFFWLNPISKVKFGLLSGGGGATAQCPPPNYTPGLKLHYITLSHIVAHPLEVSIKSQFVSITYRGKEISGASI